MKPFLLATLFSFLPVSAMPIHVQSLAAGIDIKTAKVAALVGDVSPENTQKFETEFKVTADIPGDRVILIDSNGGLVDFGQKMINLMTAEQAKGVRQICVVVHDASSMAFNLLTHCDVRLSMDGAHMLMHKVALSGETICVVQRCTFAVLEKMAIEMRKTDEPYRQANAKALGMSLPDYDLFADEDHIWRNEDLLKRKYLAGIATVGTE